MIRNNGYVGQAWLVLVLAGCFGGALAAVHVAWGPKIAENKRNATYDQIPVLVAGADKGLTEEQTVTVARRGKERTYKVYKAFAAGAAGARGDHVGWVILASGDGFADKIEILIGLDPRVEALLGLYVLDQKETPGLGDKIRSDWSGQFAGKKAAEALTVVKGAAAGNQIQALTGATVSSESVCTIVNEALDDLRERLSPKIQE